MDNLGLKGLCRCCFTEGSFKDITSTYIWMNENEVYNDMLLECFDINLTQPIDGPYSDSKQICDVCITRLRDASNFKKQVQDSEKKFIDLLQNRRIQKVEIINEQLKLEPTDDNLTAEYLEDINDDDDGDYNFECDVYESDDDEDDKPLQTLAKPKPKTVVKSPTKISKGKRAANTISENEKPEKKKLRTTIIKGQVKQRSNKAYSTRRRRNFQIIFNNTTVVPFKWRGRYKCFYCSEVIPDHLELRKHTFDHGECSIRDHSIKVIKGGRNMEIKIDISELGCVECKENFVTFENLVEHLRDVHKKDYDPSIDNVFEEYRLCDLVCHLCSEKFNYFGYLVSHMNTVHPKRCHVCEICQQKFNKHRDLFSHVKNYHREGGYSCEYCPNKFSTLNILRKHKNNRHLTRCDICYLKLPSAALKIKHLETEHPDDDSLQCSICQKDFHTKQGLKMHLKKCQNQDGDVYLEEITDENNIEDNAVKRQSVKRMKENILTVINMSTALPFNFYKNKFNCFHCSEDFTDSDCLREHTVSNHPVSDFKSKCIKKCRESNVTVKIDISSLACKVCFESTPDLDSLIDHLISKHNVSYDKSLKCLQPYKLIKDKLECPYCPGQFFRFFGTLLKHVNSNHTNNNIICVYCGQTFRKEQNLRVHIWRYHKEGQFKCTLCDTECSMPSRLYMHMAKIHGVKAAKCPKCNESFTTQYLRQKHLIDVHNTGHKCSHCGKLFVRNSFMKDHIRRTHLKEKNVECSVCSMKFFNNILLRRHMVKHSGEKNFHCDVCGERFFWRKGLVRHMGRHNKLPHLVLPI